MPIRREIALFIYMFWTVHIALSSFRPSFYNPRVNYSETISTVNPYATIPCALKFCSIRYGCIDPVLFRLYLFTLPPVSGCPEVSRADLIRFLAITSTNRNFFQSVGSIKPNSKVAIYVHGILEEYDEVQVILVAQSLLRVYDAVVLVDWSYMSNPYVVLNVPIPQANAALATINTIVVGRAVCNFVTTLMKSGQIDLRKLKIVGFSAGANSLAFIGDFCRSRYRIVFPHFVGKLCF